MSSFVLKLIAICTMLIDHSGYVIFDRFSYFNYIGRPAFPIFAFQISEGYIHTKNLKKYFLRLIIFALISQIPYMLYRSNYTFFSGFCLNIFFTLILGLVCITIYDKIVNLKIDISIYFKMFISFIIVALISYIAQCFHFEYGAFGVLIIFIFYLFKDNKFIMNLSFAFAVLAYFSKNIIHNNYDYRYILLCICTILPLIFINLYNGKKGKNIKYVLYIFYPVHLFALYLLELYF